MPFTATHVNHRRDSWPPTILSLDDADIDLWGLNEFDANPFAYFLTTPEVYDDDIEDLSAGIESDDDMFPEIRDVSPSSLQRAVLENEDDSSIPEDTTPSADSPPSPADVTEAHTSDKSPEEFNIEHITTDNHAPTTPDFRGRGRVRLLPKYTLRERGRTRSLSAPRRHSWLEPSPDVWSIPEEDEDMPDISVEDTIMHDVTPVPEWEKYQGSLEGTLNETDNSLLPVKKPKKQVRWAFDLEA